jgi:hypothetical protein
MHCWSERASLEEKQLTRGRGEKERAEGTGQVVRVKCETVCGKASVKNRVHGGKTTTEKTNRM